MKNFKIIILLLVATVFAFAGNLNFDLFSAKSNGSAINIEWKFAGDASVNYYEIERSNDNYTFRKISTQKSKNDGSIYKYADQDAFLQANNGGASVEGNLYTYRIKIVNFDNSSNYSDVTYVTHNVNSIKRTWGMLKEIFK